MGFAQITTDDVADRGVAEVVRAGVGPGRGRTGRTCRWTSTCSIRRTHPGRARPRRAGSRAASFSPWCGGSRRPPSWAADVVEVSPAYDHAEITAIAAAHVLYELVTLMARQEPD